MIYAVCIVLAVLSVWVLLSYAASGDVLAVERNARITAEKRVAVQATQIARLQPTPCSQPTYTYSPSGRC